MDILPISKPEDKPKSPLDVTKPTPQTYSSDKSEEEFDKPKATEPTPQTYSSSDESDEEFDKPKVTEVKPLAPLVPGQPKSSLDVTKPTPQTYSSDESDEEFDKPKVTEVKPLAPVVPVTSKTEEKGAMDILPISKPEDKPKSPLDVTKPTPQNTLLMNLMKNLTNLRSQR
ncbi:unnamed protein product [Ceratitis capitata]|uniref:(Mediterranean fruit fly) hypothetical protein n=1 Tax=Ceratitis capitata TaxID=7213 RepID=A0A811UXJ0_CERCA|nr:unnamed protein product [Ceratitis capitata]